MVGATSRMRTYVACRMLLTKHTMRVGELRSVVLDRAPTEEISPRFVPEDPCFVEAVGLAPACPPSVKAVLVVVEGTV